MSHPPSMPYVGRFAPSPTGPLHLGSVVAALGSCLEARCQRGRWLVRIEDIDQPRCQPGAGELILQQLEALGFEWDETPVWQSQRIALYREALAQLQAAGQVFACGCSRSELADSALARDGSRRYPGTCRTGLPAGRSARAWRLQAPAGLVVWDDALQGAQAEDVSRDVGDFVLLRADGLFAYQLAVVVDDAAQGISHVVRGADLLASTGRQIALQRALGVPTPAYTHLPVGTNAAGEKLSKQTLARSVSTLPPAAALCRALQFLGQQVPPALQVAEVRDVWGWALAHWSLTAVPHQPSLVLDESAL